MYMSSSHSCRLHCYHEGIFMVNVLFIFAIVITDTTVAL